MTAVLRAPFFILTLLTCQAEYRLRYPSGGPQNQREVSVVRRGTFRLFPHRCGSPHVLPFFVFCGS